MQSGEVLHVSDAFEKERQRVAHLFKGQTEIKEAIRLSESQPGGVVWVTTDDRVVRYGGSVMCTTAEIPRMGKR